MKVPFMRFLGFLMGIAWIVFGVFILYRHGIEGTARVFGAVAISVAGLYFINYAFTGRNTFHNRKSEYVGLYG